MLQCGSNKQLIVLGQGLSKTRIKRLRTLIIVLGAIIIASIRGF